MELARGRHTDGLILSGPRSDDTALLDLHREGFPLVLHGQLPGTNIPSGDTPNETQVRLETELVVRESCGANAR